jgi:small subunit ribosomal protein S13
MARIAGIELQDSWKVDYALTKLKGIGWSLSDNILSSAGIDKVKRVKDLTAEELARIASKLEEYPIEGDLIRDVKNNVSRLQTIGAYRGIRHSRGLPSRGQRTRSNARTKRGKRKTVGAFKKEALAKMQAQKPGGGK